MIKETYYGFNRGNPKHIEKLKYVLSLNGPKRWRAAANLYLYLNPKSYAWDEKTGQMAVAMDARTEAKIIAAECAEYRKAMIESNNPYALSRGSMSGGEDASAQRIYSLRMPATMLQFIQMIDPDLTTTTRGEEGRQKWRKLTKEFTEYSIGQI